MRFKKFSSAVLSLLICTYLFGGCSDDSVTSSGNTVSGKIVDDSNIPVSDVKVKIGSQSVLSSSDGSFKFENISFPYDLALINREGNRNFLYKGLTATNLVTPNCYLSPSTWHVAVFNVNIPPEILSPGIQGKIIFTDGNDINVIQDLKINNLLNIALPTLNQNFVGKLIVLTYQTDNGNILSYEKFGQSENFTINSYSNLSYNFTLNQFSLNPSEAKVSGEFDHPAGFTTEQSYFYLTFKTKRTNYYSIDLVFGEISNLFNFVVPEDLPVNFSVIIGNRSGNGTGSAFESYKVLANSQGLNLETKIPPSLISPPNNSTGINGSTVFTFNPGDGAGVFALEFYNYSNNSSYSVITGSNTFSFSDIITLSEINASNSEFSWSAGKRGPVNNINEYMTVYSDRVEYFGNSSGLWYFSTGE